jgi:hypothetical protein
VRTSEEASSRRPVVYRGVTECHVPPAFDSIAYIRNPLRKERGARERERREREREREREEREERARRVEGGSLSKME